MAAENSGKFQLTSGATAVIIIGWIKIIRASIYDIPAGLERVRVPRIFLAALLSASISLASPLTWTLQNVVFADGGTATGSFVYDSSNNTVVSYDISVAGGNTTTFPPFVYQNGTADNIGATATVGVGIINFVTDLIPGGYARQLRLAVLPLPATGGTVTLNIANPGASECYNCGVYRSFVSGQVTAPVPTVPALSPWPLVALAILLLGCVAVLFRLPRSKPAL
jgi:hypothetical protein